MKVLGVDYGDSRIGISLSDAGRMIAGKLTVVDGKQGRKKACEQICKLIKDNDVDTVVVGYPLNMNGSYGPRTKTTEKFISELQTQCSDIQVIRWDERLTTVAADRAMRDMGVKQKEKGVSDMIAAMMILQSYLDSLRK